MNHDEREDVCLQFGYSGCAGEEKVEDRMDKDGAKVFEDEGGSPSYLWPCNKGGGGGLNIPSERVTVKRKTFGLKGATYLYL